MTHSAAQRDSRSYGVPVRTAAWKMLRSLNSLGVVVADSAPSVGDIDSTKRPTVVDRVQ